MLFNPDTVIDRSTFEHPGVLPEGIEKVFVNGVLVWSEGKATGARPGLVLTKCASLGRSLPSPIPEHRRAQKDQSDPDSRLPWVQEHRVEHDSRGREDEQNRRPGIAGHAKGLRHVRLMAPIVEDGRRSQPVERPAGENDVVSSCSKVPLAAMTADHAELAMMAKAGVFHFG